MTMEDDTGIESAILRLLLIEHPAIYTAAELERELTRGRPGELPAGAFEEGVDRLCGAGLAHREGTLVIPSRAAIRLDRLQLA
jgi:hypothetical protein